MEAGRRALRPDTVPRALVVMGVSGSGKSTLGRALADTLGWDFVEGDDLHPPANIERMRAGIALTDADRAPWLAAVRARLDACLARAEPVVVTCSALRRAYRDVLRRPEVLFAQLHADRELLAARLAGRTGHFMPTGLLDSQLATLEPPADDEQAVTVDVSAPLADQIAVVVTRVRAASPPRR